MMTRILIISKLHSNLWLVDVAMGTWTQLTTLENEGA